MISDQIRKPSLWRGIFYSVCVCAFGASQATFAQNNAREGGDDAIEEVVVTGSYLKRNPADSPSPLSIVSAADIEDLGAQSVAEIIQTLPWQTGSVTRTSTFGGEGGRGAITMNLRNLGQSSTLVLVNGKRNIASFYDANGNAAVDINALIPNIALERIEIVKDGASALYGSDAIAGVTNFITRKKFEGFDIQYEYTTDHETKLGDTDNIQVIFGTQGDRGGVVVAAGVLNRDRITVADRYDRFGGSTASGTGQPGRFFQTAPPMWAPDNADAPDHPVNNDGNRPVVDGSLPRARDGSAYGNADVNCEDAAALEEGGPLGTVFGGAVCAYDFGSFFPLQGEESHRQFFTSGYYMLDDDIEIYYEFAGNGTEFARTNSLNPNAPALEIPVHNPGLMEDAWRRGIVAQPLINGTRLLGGTVNTSDELRPLDTESIVNRNADRMQLGATWDMELGGQAWTADISFTASEYDVAITEIQDTQSVQMKLALDGLGGPNCDYVAGNRGEGNAAYAASGGDFNAGQCYYFNPFGSNLIARDGNLQDDLALKNPAGLYRWLAGRVTWDSQFRQRVIDATLAGTLFDTASGPIGLAVGFQRRTDKGQTVFDSTTNTANLDFVYGATDWFGQLTTTAVFAEVNVPVGDSLEVNAAVRWEDFDELGVSTTDPKISVIWRPIDAFTVRGSYGSSYRVASVQQLFGSLTTVHNMTDIGANTAYRASITEGNRDLKPETTDMWNLGLSWVPGGALEGLQVDLDYYSYEYEDIIAREDFSGILAADVAALTAACECVTEATVVTADLVAAVEAGVGNRDQVVRNASGIVVRVLPNFLNANSATIEGMDIQASYSFDTDYGAFRLGLAGTYAAEYEVDTGSAVIDAVGFYNETNPVTPRRPLPQFKFNGTVNWNMASHSAYLAVRYVDGYEVKQLSGAAGFWRATIGVALGASAAANFYDDQIDSWTTADIQYTYSLNEYSFLSSSAISVGAKNFTNEEPPWVPYITAYDPVNHDARGRIWYLRVSASM